MLTPELPKANSWVPSCPQKPKGSQCGQATPPRRPGSSCPPKLTRPPAGACRRSGPVSSLDWQNPQNDPRMAGQTCWVSAGNEGTNPANHPLWFPLRESASLGSPPSPGSFPTEHQQEKGKHHPKSENDMNNSLRISAFNGTRPMKSASSYSWDPIAMDGISPSTQGDGRFLDSTAKS